MQNILTCVGILTGLLLQQIIVTVTMTRTITPTAIPTPMLTPEPENSLGSSEQPELSPQEL